LPYPTTGRMPVALPMGGYGVVLSEPTPEATLSTAKWSEWKEWLPSLSRVKTGGAV